MILAAAIEIERASPFWSIYFVQSADLKVTSINKYVGSGVNSLTASHIANLLAS